MSPSHLPARRARRPFIFAALALLLLLQTAAVPAAALSGAAATPIDTIYGLINTNTLIRFSSATPGTINQTTPVTGLLLGTQLVALDFRPKTGQLYAIGLTGSGTAAGRVYAINPATGAAILSGITPFSNTMSPNAYYNMDFNPVVDRIRLVDNLDANLRVNPSNGALAATDVNLNRPSNDPAVTALAYDRNLLGTGSSTVYGIDYSLNQLVMIGGANGTPSANLGLISQVGPMGVTTQSPDVGLDISSGAKAYASLRAGGKFGLYTINLSTGAATLVGAIGTGTGPIVDIAVAPHYTVFLPLVRR